MQAIARGREDGKTVIELGGEFDHDQKSLFHFVKNLVEMNFIVKMKVVDRKATTSRCIHRHYLETSEHWATFTEMEAEEAANAQGNNGEEDAEEEVQKTDEAFPMTVQHLSYHESFVRGRILSALRRAPENTIAHTDIVYRIVSTVISN